MNDIELKINSMEELKKTQKYDYTTFTHQMDIIYYVRLSKT